MSQLKQSLLAAVGGAWSGMALSLVPQLEGLAEARNFSMFLLEISHKVLSRGLAPGLIRGLSTGWGELAIFVGLGALLGAGLGWLLYGFGARFTRRWATSPMLVGLSATAGLLALLGMGLWIRVVMVHASLRRLISVEGIAWAGLACALALAVGVGVFAALRLVWSRRALRAALGIGLAVVALFMRGGQDVLGVTHATATSPVIRQVIVLGVDGATWDVARPLLKQGRLPHLARLVEGGAWAELRSTLPWKSPVLWASIGTGKRERGHGIHDFVVRDEETHEVLPVSIGARRVKAIWDIASEHGRRVDVVNWYASWPAEPLNGTMVSDRFLFGEVPDRVFPAERTGELERLVRRLEATGLPRSEAMMAEIGLHLLLQDQPELHILYMRETDHMQHFFWKQHALRRGSLLARWLYGQANPAELSEHGAKIEAAYERADAVLGRLVAQGGPDTAVVVVSDHGGGIKAAGKLRFDLNPLLAALGHLRYQSDGKTVDWAATTVYDATKQSWNEQRELFINGRDEGPFGGAPDPQVWQRLADTVGGQLAQLRTSAGQPVVTLASLGQAEAGDSPPLIARVNVRLESTDVIEGPPEALPVSKVVWKAPWTGTHRLPGLLAMAGPGIKPGYQLQAATILDITPTLLYLLGLPAADDMEGRVLLEAIEPAFRKAHPVRLIASYETDAGHRATAARRSGADEDLLEELRSLGYIQ